MEILYIKEFLCLSKYLNYSEAAYALNITQSTLSRHIQQMENELNVQLFYRTRSRYPIQLTEAGERIFAECEHMVEHYEQIGGIIASYKKGLEGKINIGYIRAHDDTLIIDVIRQFRISHPNINAVYQCSSDLSRIYTNFINGELDIVIIPMLDELKSEEYHCTTLLKSSLSAIINSENSFTKRDRLSLNDLKGQELLIPNVTTHMSMAVRFRDFFQETTEASAILMKDSMDAADLYVALETGMNIVPTCYVNHSSKRLKGLEIEGTEDFCEIVVVRKKNNHNEAVRHFIDVVKREIQKNH